jgi:hypothetical protein
MAIPHRVRPTPRRRHHRLPRWLYEEPLSVPLAISCTRDHDQ